VTIAIDLFVTSSMILARGPNTCGVDPTDDELSCEASSTGC
jgi:hypothetical protein